MKPESSFVCLVLLVSVMLMTACTSGLPEIAPTLEPAVNITATPILPAATPTRQPTPTPTELPYKILSDVPYVPDGHAKQKFDFYIPQGQGPFPTVLFISEAGNHAAFWHDYNRQNYSNVTRLNYRELGSYLAEIGYAAVIMDYRLPPDFVFPTQLQDAFCALAWLHANAGDYGFDTQRVAAMGVAYGADLAALLGVVDDPAPYLENCPYGLPNAGYLHGVITYTGIYQHTEDNPNPRLLSNIMGGTWLEVPERYREASSLLAVDGSEPPFLLIHSLDDTNVPIDKAQHFAAALEAVGVNVKSLWLPRDYTYGYAIRNAVPCSKLELDTVESFLTQIFK